MDSREIPSLGESRGLILGNADVFRREADTQPGMTGFNLGGLRFTSRSGHVRAGAVLVAIGPAGNSRPAAEVEVGLAWITNRPEARRRPITSPSGLEKRPELDLADLLRQWRSLRLLGP